MGELDYARENPDPNDVNDNPDADPEPELEDEEDEAEDTGRYQGGYRIYRDGSMREDFGADR